MTMRRIASLLFLCLCGTHALAQAPAAATPADAAPVIHLPLPWKVGQVLRYAYENTDAKQSPGKREKTRLTSITELRTQRADKDGFDVDWASHDTAYKTLEGNTALDALMAPAMAQMEQIPMVVVLDADGAYRSIRNIDQLSARMRVAMAPVAKASLEAGLQAAPPPQAGSAEERRAQAEAVLKTYLDNITSPKLLEATATRQVRNIAFFNAGGLEDDAWYTLETELPNPTGGANFPAKLEYGLWVSEDDPEDVYIRWTSTIDPVKGAAALADTVRRLFGEGLPLAPEDLPKQVAIEDAGLILVHRPTGMVEMYEDERTTTFGETKNYERTRMRLLDAGHGHEWADESNVKSAKDVEAG